MSLTFLRVFTRVRCKLAATYAVSRAWKRWRTCTRALIEIKKNTCNTRDICMCMLHVLRNVKLVSPCDLPDPTWPDPILRFSGSFNILRVDAENFATRSSETRRACDRYPGGFYYYILSVSYTTVGRFFRLRDTLDRQRNHFYGILWLRVYAAFSWVANNFESIDLCVICNAISW